jgi:hypothetical protein
VYNLAAFEFKKEIPVDDSELDYTEPRSSSPQWHPADRQRCVRAGAVSCLAQLGIPDLLETGAKSAEELAAQTGARPDALYRLMRATACVGVLAEGSDKKFSQMPMSAVLRTNAHPSLRGLAIMTGREWHGRGWSRLEYCVRTGRQALDEIYGMTIFDYLKHNPEESRISDNAMTGLSGIDGPAVADA